MIDRDVLSTIPGALLSAAIHSLPDPASSENDTERRVIQLPDGLRAEVTFARLRRSHKNVRDSRWFWTPASAVIVEE
jgi:hypothetical protein